MGGIKPGQIIGIEPGEIIHFQARRHRDGTGDIVEDHEYCDTCLHKGTCERCIRKGNGRPSEWEPGILSAESDCDSCLRQGCQYRDGTKRLNCPMRKRSAV